MLASDNQSINYQVKLLSEYLAGDTGKAAITFLKETNLDKVVELFPKNAWVYNTLSRVLDKHKGKMVPSAKEIEEDFLAFLKKEITPQGQIAAGIGAFLEKLKETVDVRLATKLDHEIALASQHGENVQYSHQQFKESIAMKEKDSDHKPNVTWSVAKYIPTEYSIGDFLEDDKVQALMECEYALLSGINIGQARSDLEDMKVINIMDIARTSGWSQENKDEQNIRIKEAIKAAAEGKARFLKISDMIHWVCIALLPDSSAPGVIKVVYMNSAYGQGGEEYLWCKLTGLDLLSKIIKEVEATVDASKFDAKFKAQSNQVLLNPTQQLGSNCGVMTAMNIAALARYWKSKGGHNIDINEFASGIFISLYPNKILSSTIPAAEKKNLFVSYIQSLAVGNTPQESFEKSASGPLGSLYEIVAFDSEMIKSIKLSITTEDDAKIKNFITKDKKVEIESKVSSLLPYFVSMVFDIIERNRFITGEHKDMLYTEDELRAAYDLVKAEAEKKGLIYLQADIEQGGLKKPQSVIIPKSSSKVNKIHTASSALTVPSDVQGIDLIRVHKEDDIKNLKEIYKHIESFALANADYNKLFQQIGKAASLIHFNDGREGCHDYIRNKYGFTDRSEGGTQREGGLKFEHLAALRHIVKMVPTLDAALHETLVEGLTVVKEKMEIVIKLETGAISKTPEEILQFLKGSEKLQKAEKYLWEFISYHYSKILTDQMLEILADKNLKNLNFKNRGDRYYLGTTLSMLGEMSKELRDLLNPGQEGGLFVTLKKIRDKRLAHSNSAFIMEPNETQIKYIAFLLEVVLFGNFQARVQTIRKAIEEYRGSTKGFTADLGANSLEAKRLLKKLVKLIFEWTAHEVDQDKKSDDTLDLLDLSELKEAIDASSILSAVSQNSPLIILGEIRDAVSNLAKPAKYGKEERSQRKSEQMLNKTLKLLVAYNSSPSRLKFKDVTVLPSLDEVESLIKASKTSKKVRPENSLDVLLIRIKDNTEKYHRFFGSTKKGHVETVARHKNTALALIKEFNEKSSVVGATKFLSTTELPAIDQIEAIIEDVKKLNQSVQSKVETEEALRNNTKSSEYSKVICNTRVQAANENKKAQVAEDVQALKQELRSALKKVSKEFAYIVQVLRNTELSEVKKDYITRFALTKIGQLFRDVEKESKLIATLTDYEHKQSVRDIVAARNKLMHDIIASLKLSVSNILFRKTLPMIPEIKALVEVLQADEKGDGNALFKLGRAYIELKQYDKAFECFGKMMLLAESEILIAVELINKEKDPMKSFSNYISALFGLALVYEAFAKEKRLDGQSVKSVYAKQAEMYERYLKNIKFLESFGIRLYDQTASAHSALGITYGYMGDFDKAIEEHKKALTDLAQASQMNWNVYAAYLSRFGDALWAKANDQLCQCALMETKTIQPLELSIFRQMRSTATCLREAKEIFEKVGAEQTSPLYIDILIYLILALMYESNDEVQYLYTQEVYAKLKEIEPKIIGREESEEILAIKKVKTNMDLLANKMDGSVSESIKNKFKLQRDVVNAEMDFKHLQRLRIFYSEVGVRINIEERMSISKAKLSQYRTQVSRDTLLCLDVEDPSSTASHYFKQGKFMEALELYKKALSALSNSYKDYIPSILGDLLESIGDIYSALDKNDKAIHFFTKSLETHYKYGPNDRAFNIPKKIIESNQKIDILTSPQKNQAFITDVIKKLSTKVGKDDPRLNNLKSLYNCIESHINTFLSEPNKSSTSMSNQPTGASASISNNPPSITKSQAAGVQEREWLRVLTYSYNLKNSIKKLRSPCSIEVGIHKKYIKELEIFLNKMGFCKPTRFKIQPSGDYLVILLQNQKAIQAMQDLASPTKEASL